MAVARDKEAYFGDELSASSIMSMRDLQQRFPEIPADVVSSSLIKNGGNMSCCIKELELASPSYMYGDFVSHNTPIYDESTVPKPAPRTNIDTTTYTSQFYTPEPMVPIRDPYDHEMILQDREWRPPPSVTSWVSVETGVPGLELRPEPVGNPSTADEQTHVSLCTLDIQKPPMRTISAPNETGRGSPMPGDSQFRGEPPHRQSSSPYGRTSNGVEQRMDPQKFPFEPRPAWVEQSTPIHEPNDRSTPPHPSMQAAETTYQLPAVKPSSPSPKPRKPRQSQTPTVATYSKATDRISFNPIFAGSTQEPARASPKPGDEFPAQRTETSQSGMTEPIPPRRKDRSKRKEASLGPSTVPLDSSTSKEKEDQAYNEALLMHQKARYERLLKELEDERKKLDHMRKMTSNMEQEVSEKRKNHRSPFPTREEIAKLRERKHQLQIDIECMTREIESYKSQGLMDVTQATSFYGNIGSTGAPGPVPPMSNNSPIPESNLSVIDAEAPPPSYDSLQWSCPACTLLNHPALDKCEACESPRK